MIQYFKNHLDYHVLLDEHPGHVITDTHKSAELLEQADLIFCEWCLGNAVWYSHHKRNDQKLLIRLHHQELDLPFLDNLCWENVDGIILISQNNLRIFQERYPGHAKKARLISNVIDCAELNQPKLYGAEFNLGIVGISPKRKGFHRAVELLNRLKKVDQRFTLFVKGNLPWEYDWLWRRPEERRYYEELFLEISRSPHRNSIVFEPYGEDMPVWFSKVGFLLSTSDHEGSHQVVAEGMASGAIPIIRNWDGANLIYPPKYVFETLEQAVHLLKKWKSPENYRNETEQVKEYAFVNFDRSQLVPIYEQLFDELLESPGKVQAPAAAPPAPAAVKNESKGEGAAGLRIMHVCYINPGVHDGYVTRVLEEARVLNQAGVQVVLACYLHPDFFTHPDQIAEHLAFLRNYTGAKVHFIPVEGFFDPAALTHRRDLIAAPLVKIAKNYDVQIIHGQSIYSTMYALEANKQIKAKLVFDMHGIAVGEAEMAGESPRRIDVISKGDKEILRAADLVVFVSTQMRKHFDEKFGVPFDNSIIIPTCVQSEKFSMPLELRTRKRKGLGLADRFVILYLGTLGVWQWPEAMFALFKRIHSRQPDTLFYLLLPESNHQKALQFLQEQNLPEDSYMIQAAPHNEVGSLIGVADAGLLLRQDHPVNRVSSPTKFGEYMAAGVPVIATDKIGDFSEIIQQENLGLVLSLDSEQISPINLKQISQFMGDVRKNRTMWAERCSQYARSQLDWEVYKNPLQEAYRRLLKPDQGVS
ncbi:MAG: glycosyltransferase [Anaerolineales bacterium]|nr:glycosyltransferase [Anaerolineales bacterium]